MIREDTKKNVQYICMINIHINKNIVDTIVTYKQLMEGKVCDFIDSIQGCCKASDVHR